MAQQKKPRDPGAGHRETAEPAKFEVGADHSIVAAVTAGHGSKAEGNITVEAIHAESVYLVVGGAPGPASERQSNARAGGQSERRIARAATSARSEVKWWLGVFDEMAEETRDRRPQQKQRNSAAQNPTPIVKIDGSRNELISILEDRAARIVASLSKHYRYARIRDYVARFEDLHRRHVDSLRAGELVRAYDIMRAIQRLSYELEADEFWTNHHINSPDVCYSLDPECFLCGPMICVYSFGRKHVKRTLSVLPTTDNMRKGGAADSLIEIASVYADVIPRRTR